MVASASAGFSSSGGSSSYELSNWSPALKSADKDYLKDRNKVVARARDLANTSGWASGALSRHLDSVIGTGFRLSSKPDYKALGLTPEWADDFAEKIETRWRLFADDPDFWIDASRQLNFSGILALAFRQYLLDGEALGVSLWLDEKPFGKYATTILMVDPDRLSNPDGKPDGDLIRGGVQLSNEMAPVSYFIRKKHPNDWQYGASTFVWECVPRETPWGRRTVIHAYEKERADQTRGKSYMAPILERLKMIDKYDHVELQAAVLNAVFAAFIESPMDPEMLGESLGVDSSEVSTYQSQRKEFHDDRHISVDGVRLPTLFPGEKVGTVNAARPAAQFGDFEKACLRNIASGLGLSYEQLSQDWSDVNYSSARAALLEVGKHQARMRKSFADQFATPIFHLWLEEAFSRGDLEIPAGAPDFYTAKAAYGSMRWIGTARGWVDPMKEVGAAQMRLDMGVSTLEDECAEQGKDWQDVLRQRAREIKVMEEHGLVAPAWAKNLGSNSQESRE